MPKPRAKFFYTGIRVRNLARSIAFYETLGFQVRWHGKMPHGGEWVRLAQPGSSRELELNYYPPGSRYYTPIGRSPQFDHFGVAVSDFSYWYRKLRSSGARVLIRPFENWDETFQVTWRLAYLLDPDGFPIEIWAKAPKRGRSKAAPLRHPKDPADPPRVRLR
jgi:catechol 2,3-dioxygenase-like lactoylglutathione lyase family enzyme